MLSDRSDGKQRFLVVRDDIIQARKSFGFSIKFVLFTWETNPDLMEKQRSLFLTQKIKGSVFGPGVGSSSRYTDAN